MAGNIPLVGFFDLLCVVVAGHRCLVKPSAKDTVLMEYVVGLLREIDPAVPVSFCDGTAPAEAVIATGGDDGKVKLWSVTSGFCFVTFSDHPSAITDICYVKGSHAIVSASLDGTVSAFDLVRYRNFRTLTTPTPEQLT